MIDVVGVTNGCELKSECHSYDDDGQKRNSCYHFDLRQSQTKPRELTMQRWYRLPTPHRILSQNPGLTYIVSLPISNKTMKMTSTRPNPDFSPVKKNKAALYGIRAVSPNSYAKGEARPYGNTVYNRTNGISATGASWR